MEHRLREIGRRDVCVPEHRDFDLARTRSGFGFDARRSIPTQH